jgi:phosphatidylinositol alpha-1,6-mannosyltransferase
VRMPLSLRSWGLRSLEGLRGFPRAIWRLRQIVKAERIDMLHCGRCLPEGIMALALKHWSNVPYACYAHGEEINYASMSRELSWLLRKVLNGAEFVIANSRNTARLLRNSWKLPEGRIELLYPGVDTKRFAPAARDAAVRRDLGWGNRPVILTVGRLQKRKGHDHMIQALCAIKQIIPDVLYGIVGDGEERDSLQDLAKREGVDEQVQFLGQVDDDQLVRCYQQCDLFILPNRQIGADIEGFGMVLLEAQACGKPVVAGVSGGTAETMSIPHTGRVVCCDQPPRLAALVIELLTDCSQVERMGARARQWTVEHFDWRALSDRAALIFQRLCA